jgi:hypothetical protein
LMRSDAVTRVEERNPSRHHGSRTSVEDIFRRGLCVLAGMAVGGGIIWGWQMAGSILLGGGIACLNFHWLKLAVDRVLTGHSRHSPTVLMMGFVGRLLLILGGLFAIIQLSFLSLFGALGGMAIFIVAGCLEAILLLVRKQ